MSKDNQIDEDNSQIATLQTEVLSNPIIAQLQGQIISQQNQISTLQNQIASDQTTISSLNTQVANDASTFANWDSPVQNGFSLIQITDTQYLSDVYPPSFNTLTSWIANNSKALNVQMVIHTGDIVNVPDNLAQWQSANAAMMQLYNNGVPYCWDAGNHDVIGEMTPNGNSNGVWLGGEGFPAFDVTAMQREPYWVASIFNGSSTAVQFSYGNYHFMVINVAYDANQTVIDWMQTLIKCNPNVNVIVATHNFLNGVGTYGFTASQPDIDWATNFKSVLDTDPNVFLTLSGHDINEGTASIVKSGNRTDIFYNRQMQDNLQGGASVRRYTFNMTNAANPTVSVYTYLTYPSGSAGTPMYLTDSADQFSFTTNLTAYSAPLVSLAGGTKFDGASGYTTSFANPITLAAYNQTGDLLRFYNLTLNGVTSNVTVSTVGANLTINSYSTASINCTVSGNGTETFLTNVNPTTVTIDDSLASPSSGKWSYSNGTVTVTGASTSIIISLT